MVMRGSRVRSGAAAAALILFACSKDDKAGGSNEPAQAAENRAKAEKLSAPPMFAHIPADTPYAVATFEPVPRSYWETLAPTLKMVLDEMPVPGDTSSASPEEHFAYGFLRDLRADFSEAGVKKLIGIGADQRFAVYGIGVLPVMRIELADSKALLATVERLQRESGLALPTASVGGRTYWRFVEDDVLIVAAVADEQLIVSGGPAAQVDAALPFILGVEKPNPNMADGGAIKKVAALHGFTGYGVGFLDAANLLKLLTVANFFRGAGAEPALPPACMEELGALVRRFPRFSFGYDELSAKRVAFRLVLETDAGLVARLKQLTVEVPGLVAGLADDHPLFAVGLGIDLDKARQLAVDFMTAGEALGRACANEEMASEMAEARAAVSQPLPPGLDKIRGGLVGVLDGEMSGGMPRNIEAYGVIAADDPAALLTFMKQQAPAGQIPDVPADGKFHDLLPEGMIPGIGAIRVAVKSKALVAAMGNKGTEAADRALGRTGTSPLVFLSYDYAKILKKIMAESGGGGPPEMQKMMSLLGTISVWMYPTDQGFTTAMSMDMP